jgi:serine/threonine protein kinase
MGASRFRIALVALAAILATSPAQRAEAACSKERLLQLFETIVVYVGDPYTTLGREAAELYRVDRLKKPMGAGVEGTVYEGALPEVLPEDIKEAMKRAGINWAPRTAIAVKALKAYLPFTGALFRREISEARMINAIARYDDQELFVRGFRDPVRNLLITERDENMISLGDWGDRHAKPGDSSPVSTIMSQLEIALKELRLAGILHGDLRPRNILIDPRTLKIKIIDFGIATYVGSGASEPDPFAEDEYDVLRIRYFLQRVTQPER